MNVIELNEILATKLKSGVVSFAYRKKNGEIRLGNGTTKSDIVPENLQPSGKVTISNTSKRYYDIDSEGWRSFVCDNLIWVEGNEFADNVTEDEKKFITNTIIPN